MAGSGERAREALRSRDFRWLLGTRLLSQFADGLFQAFLIDTLVFLSPEKQGTAVGVAKAFAVLIIPFSLLGPLSGVLIDRWSRRRILTVTPLLRAAAVVILMFASGHATWLLYALSLVVVSGNRFYLVTAGAVMPLLVADEDLLVGNSMAGSAGTVVTFVNTEDQPGGSGAAHFVTNAADGSLIVPGLLSPGDSSSVEFDNPGIISYNCSIHPGMVGTITVQ